MVNKDKRFPGGGSSEPQPARVSGADELIRNLQSEMRRPQPSPDAITAALQAAQRLAAEADTEQAADDHARELADSSDMIVCEECGHRNRMGNKFCGMCGVAIPLEAVPGAALAPSGPSVPPNQFVERHPGDAGSGRGVLESHHYHHHYHHHYFPGGQEGMVARPASADSARDIDRMRPTAALRGDMSRAEAAVRRVTHEWVLACNTKHLDDLLDLYVADALVLRSNIPPVRGAAAVREFFFGALDSGLGEVEVDPLRVEVVGDLAYEAGRCNALVPSASGKRREERGKYLWVCARQSNGEWKLAADCWSSDLTFSTLESDVPAGGGVKTNQPRK